jgi:uncharacterized OsmC-like protein
MTTQANTNGTPKRQPVPLNGVDTPTLFATINAVGQQPELANFRFRATNEWIAGTHSRSTIETFSGAGGEHNHSATFIYDADHPEVLCAKDQGPTPVEFILVALASCLMAGIGNIAAARGVKLTSVKAEIEGDINLLGLLGISNEVRNGYKGLDVRFDIKGDAPPEKLQAIVEQSRDRSAVYDVVTNGVPVNITVNPN